uniref:AMP-binding protein n=1 Tax=Puniceibacterium confluentis TaxID=1958944 RepID=UPI0035680EC3
MATRRITVVKATPTYLHLLLSTPDPARFAALTRWRLLILGGESPDADQIDHLSRLCPWLHLACHYGPTETTVGCAMTAPRPIRDWTADRTTIIGTPVRGTEIRIVDRHGDTLPRGVRGEIAVGGTALARGYLPPAQPDGFTRIGGQRFYRTGDLGSLGTDGMLRFAGRRDGIGKIRGHRVDPEETRLALLRDGSVAEAAVAVQGAGPKAQLVAFVRTSDGLRDPARLRAAVARRLPSAQVPQRFVFLSRLLMTENGKTDTAAMLAALGAEPRRTGPGSPPRTATERHLARIWTEVLGLDSVARDDDFFLLGGHSLRAIEVSGALERDGGLRLPLRWFTDAPVLCDLAARIDAAQAGGAARPVVPVSAIMRLYGTDDAAGMLCFPGPMGNSGIYREWLETLAPGCAVDGVDDLPELDAAADVPAMVRWILEQAPDGGRGYRVLLGWSFGADLAYEAAAQLGALGIAPLLVMLDRLPGEPQFGPALGDSPLETRRYWSQVLGVLSSALPESDVARYKAQFAQRAARQRAYEPPTPSAARIACVLSAADGAVAPGRIDHLATLSGQRACISAKGADHFNLFHPPHVARWSVALRRLITERLTGAQAEPDEPAHPPPAARQTFAINEVEV